MGDNTAIEWADATCRILQWDHGTAQRRPQRHASACRSRCTSTTAPRDSSGAHDAESGIPWPSSDGTGPGPMVCRRSANGAATPVSVPPTNLDPVQLPAAGMSPPATGTSSKRDAASTIWSTAESSPDRTLFPAPTAVTSVTARATSTTITSATRRNTTRTSSRSVLSATTTGRR